MPHFEWKEDDMRYSMAAFPLVGAVIGAIFYALYRSAEYFALPHTASALLLTAVPVALTGGFHVDGFMDVSDALNSYRSREEKLKILKDPHIGAFAVIRLAICGLVYIASLTIVLDSEEANSLIVMIAAGFVLARCLSALSVLTFRSAKKEGMLYYEASSAAGGRRGNLVMVSLLGSASLLIMGYFSLPAGCIASAAAILSFGWYKHLSYRELGGITGDTAGYFVVICETAIAASAAIAAIVV